MWFKNLQVYRFTRPFELTAEQLETQLEACAFTPCGSQDISRFGWTRPLGKFGRTLTQAAAGQILICARKEDKILQSSVIKEALAEKVEAIEMEQGRALKKKEKEALKEELLHTMLPRAFSRTANTLAWINPADGLLMVDTSSAKKADDVLALNWGERISFVLGDDLSIKRLKFSEDLREQNDDITSEDPPAWTPTLRWLPACYPSSSLHYLPL